MQNSNVNILPPLMRRHIQNKKANHHWLERDKKRKTKANQKKRIEDKALHFNDGSAIPEPAPYETLVPKLTAKGELILPNVQAEYLNSEQAGYLLGLTPSRMRMLALDSTLEVRKCYVKRKGFYYFSVSNLMEFLNVRLRDTRKRKAYLKYF